MEKVGQRAGYSKVKEEANRTLTYWPSILRWWCPPSPQEAWCLLCGLWSGWFSLLACLTWGVHARVVQMKSEWKDSCAATVATFYIYFCSSCAQIIFLFCWRRLSKHCPATAPCFQSILGSVLSGWGRKCKRQPTEVSAQLWTIVVLVFKRFLLWD